MEVHKDGIAIAVAEDPRGAEVRHLGTVPGGVVAVTRSLRKLVSAGHVLYIACEAGPCDFVLQRLLTAQDWRCDVVAPSLNPCKRSAAAYPVLGYAAALAGVLMPISALLTPVGRRARAPGALRTPSQAGLPLGQRRSVVFAPTPPRISSTRRRAP